MIALILTLDVAWTGLAVHLKTHVLDFERHHFHHRTEGPHHCAEYLWCCHCGVHRGVENCHYNMMRLFGPSRYLWFRHLGVLVAVSLFVKFSPLWLPHLWGRRWVVDCRFNFMNCGGWCYMYKYCRVCTRDLTPQHLPHSPEAQSTHFCDIISNHHRSSATESCTAGKFLAPR